MSQWGGKREGAGRPATGRRKRMVYVTDEEFAKIKKTLEDERNMENFFKTETYTVDRGYTIHLSRAPEYVTEAVVEDADGKRSLVDIGHRVWADFEEMLDVIVGEYEKL